MAHRKPSKRKAKREEVKVQVYKAAIKTILNI